MISDPEPIWTVENDAEGKFVSPGLIDMHIHGYLGKDVCDGEEESIRVIAEGIVKNGVTAFLPTTMTESMEIFVNPCAVIKAFIPSVS